MTNKLYGLKSLDQNTGWGIPYLTVLRETEVLSFGNRSRKFGFSFMRTLYGQLAMSIELIAKDPWILNIGPLINHIPISTNINTECLFSDLTTEEGN